MSWVLLGNDDGLDAPALLPFADALERTLELPVRIAVPDGERSWSGKAVTRRGDIRSLRVQRGGRDVVAVDGTPADAIQLGLYGLFVEEFAATPPALVVTGVNIGFNAGSGFLASSGTVWAAAEAAYAGLPAVALSTGPTRGADGYHSWRAQATAADGRAARSWQRVAAIAAETVGAIDGSDLLEHCDLVSVNLPWEARAGAARTVTSLSTLSYGSLFEPSEDGHRHTARQQLELHIVEDGPGGRGDVGALRDGHVSITPVVLPRSAEVPLRTVDAIERDHADGAGEPPQD